jgi:antagonist of KipI
MPLPGRRSGQVLRRRQLTAVLDVVTPGISTTIQDLGRPHAISAGVPPGGAMDRFAHRAANLLVGNDEGAATLECTVSGPQLRARHACLIAVTGADLEPLVDGRPIQAWTGVFLGQGDRLTFGSRRSGARAYIAIAGGFAADRWLGSLSTNLLAARGGYKGRIVKAGDVLEPAGEPSKPVVSGRHLAERSRPRYLDHTLHAISGPHVKRLGAEGRKAFFSSPFKVSRDADRMGYRLEGHKLVMTGDEILSFGLTAGAVQVPHSGQPILLMADHQTAGGYPVVATVVSAALPIAAQLLPGDEVYFEETTIARSQQMRQSMRAGLDSIRGTTGR